MTALVVTVFLASLTGSLHCAGMCGAFVAFAVGRDTSRTRSTLHVAYNGGRLVTYLVLGAIAGGLGAALDLGGAVFGIQRVALAGAGAAMVAFGVVSLLDTVGVRTWRGEPPAFLQSLFLRLHRAAAHLTPAGRALCIGLLTTLLPCGWLYAFAIAAAGTGSPLLGALTMGLFWVGTLPVMVALGAGIRRLADPLLRHAPAVTAVALVIVGLVAIAGRLSVPALSAAGAPSDSVEQAVSRVEALDPGALSCHGEEP